MSGSEIFLGFLAFGVTFLTAGLMFGIAMLRAKKPAPVRNIPAYDHLHKAVGRLVEDGTRLHVSLGRGGLVTAQSASALAGLTLLRRLAAMTSAGDKPPIATSGEAALALLSQDTLQGAASQYNRLTHDPSAGRLTGLTPFSYAAGVIGSIRDENVSASILMGNFGIEAALLADAAERANTFTLAGSDNLVAQAVLYATSEQPLLGEEVFAAGAYATPDPVHAASLSTQDILRWFIIIAMLFGALLKLTGIL